MNARSSLVLALLFATGMATAESRVDSAFRLTMPPGAASDQNPAFSPDGSRLVFSRFDNGYNEGPAGLFVLHVATGAVQPITPDEDQDNVNLPGSAWNRVTDRIVFASDRVEADDLWQMAPDGGALQRITSHSGADWCLEPSWSPDGEWIVFERSVSATTADGRIGEIWKVAADGSGVVVLSADSAWDDRQPNWSPVGNRIVFHRRPRDGDAWSLYSMHADGSDLQPLVDDPDSDDSDASWSPDGTMLVFSSNLGTDRAPVIAAAPVDGGAVTSVTCDPDSWDGAPSWSPDGSWVAFESHPGDEEPAALWGIRLADSPCFEAEDASRVRRGGRRVSPGASENIVNDFVYQLQNLDLVAVGATAYDLAIIDYSADGDDFAAFTATEIDQLRHSPGGAKIVLAYLSIGEAEDYRFYWLSGFEPGSPAWLDAENPDWPGNYKVHYWDPEWQTIVLAYVDRLLAAGFDGAYLDIIDAYEYYEEANRTTAAQEMADFVAAIAAHARAVDPDFLIFPQNAPELASRIPAYLATIDGIGQESVYYGWDETGVATPASVTAFLEQQLAVIRSAGKLVLTVDYTSDPQQIDTAYGRSSANGFVPYVTGVDLDRLTINPGHEPD